MSTPTRIQLRRAKGWRMPPNTIKVDRTTPWGNPLVVGKHGTREECVQLLAYALNGAICVSLGKDEDGQWMGDKLIAYRKRVIRQGHMLRGKNLACWCPFNSKCHADLLIEAVNR